MKVIALLPMKANSERVKGKNFKTFVVSHYLDGCLIH